MNAARGIINGLLLALAFWSILGVCLWAGTYERTVDMGSPETDVEVVETGRRALVLIDEGYVVYLNGSILTHDEAADMAQF